MKSNYKCKIILVCKTNICTNTSKCECMLGVGGVKSYTIVSDIQNAAGGYYLQEKQQSHWVLRGETITSPCLGNDTGRLDAPQQDQI